MFNTTKMSREYFIKQNVDFRYVHNPPKNIRIYVTRKGQKRREHFATNVLGRLPFRKFSNRQNGAHFVL